MANGDSLPYHRQALGLLESHSFHSFGAFRTPGYPVFLAVVYYLFGVKPWLVLLIQVFLNIGSVIVFYFLTRTLLGYTAALAATFIYSLEPHTLFYSINLLPDSVLVTLFLSSSLLLAYGLKENRFIHISISGFLMGLATIVKPVTQFFPLVCAILILLFMVKSYLFRFRSVTLYACLFLLPLSPWLHRNFSEYGYLSLSQIQGFNLLFYNVTITEASRTGQPVNQVRNIFSRRAEMLGARSYRDTVASFGHNEEAKGGHNPFEDSMVYGTLAKDYVFSHVREYSLMHLRGIVNMYINLGTKDISKYLGYSSTELSIESFTSTGLDELILNFIKYKSLQEIIIGISIAAFLLISYSLFLFGSFMMLWQRQYLSASFIFIVIIYFSMVVGVVGECRYKLPVIPFYSMASGYGLSVLGFFKVKSRKY